MESKAAQNVLAVAHVIDAIQQIKEQAPLAMSTLWHNKPPRTSQRAPLQIAGVDAVLAAGGNGSGKTELGGQMAVAVAMGRDHPAVQRWIRRNQIEPSIIPPKPGIVLASSLNSTLSINVQRPAVERYVPRGTEWRNRDGAGFSEARLPGGGRIRFLTNDAGARAMQGYAGHLLWLDEEHDESIFNEGMQRLTRKRWEGRSGICLMTMTPLKGLTWVHRRFISDPDENTAAFFLHGGDNPYIDQVKRERLLRSVTAGERAARDRGEFTQLEGRIFTDFQRHVHVIPSMEVPREWPKYMAIDFGTRAPFACVVMALDPSDDVLHVIDVHYQTEWTLRQHARVIHQFIEKYGEPEWIVADPEDKGSRLALSRDHGLPNIPARKGKGSVRKGINDVCERLALDVEGRPHLLFHENCTEVIQEIETYVWDERRDGEINDQPKPRQADHAIDALRYACMRLAYKEFSIG